jgi:ABC-type enterochelin transport system permease subunit
MFLGLIDAHKLYTSVFKSRNVFLVMNMDPKEYKKVEKRMSFSSNDSSRYHRQLFKM